jgi:hypothetical protein
MMSIAGSGRVLLLRLVAVLGSRVIAAPLPLNGGGQYPELRSLSIASSGHVVLSAARDC